MITDYIVYIYIYMLLNSLLYYVIYKNSNP